MHRFRFVALAAVALPAAALCQPGPEQVRPGTPLDMTFIRPGLDSAAILMARGGDTMRVGLAVMETRIDSTSGERRIVEVHRMSLGPGAPATADSSHLRWQTLLPISSHTRGDSPYDYHFGPSGVRVVTIRDGRAREVALDAPVFYEGSVVLLLRALPLRVGYRAVLPVLTPGGAPGEMHVTVTGEEDVRTLDGGTCACLVVEVRTGRNVGTHRLATATRALVRFDSEYAILVRPTGCP